MSANFFDFANAFRSYIRNVGTTANAQALYWFLLSEFNAGYFPSSLTFSDKELIRLVKVKSHATLIDAKRRLKNAGLIDFTQAGNNQTIYRLINPTAIRPQSERDSTSGGDFDFRTRDEKLETDYNSTRAQKTAGARARESEQRSIHDERADTIGTADQPRNDCNVPEAASRNSTICIKTAADLQRLYRERTKANSSPNS